MKKVFACSLICRNGMIGGGLYMEDDALIYKTNKLTVDRKYRNLVMPRNEICSLSWKRMVFPIVTLHMTDGEEYQFVMFNQKRFNKCYGEGLRS